MNSVSRFSIHKISAVFVVLGALIAPATHAQGLAKATGFLETIRDSLSTLVPIVGIIAGILLVMAYWFRMIEKDTFIRWLVGLIIAGSVTEIVALFV